jgi:glycosyltransferase involved in cell wall biosynthesis
MHVAYIHQHFSTRQGSVGTRSFEFAKRLIRAGHSVSMIAGANTRTDFARRDGERVTEQSIDGIRVLSVAEIYDNSMGFVRRALAFGRFARTAAKLVRQTGADLVFATSTPLTVGEPGRKGAEHLGVPFVFEVRDLWPELPIAMGIVRNPFMKWYLTRMERNIYGAAARIIALAPGIRDGIVRTGYSADRIDVIPNACDLDLFVPTDERLQDARFGNPDDFKLVFTGAHGLANGLDAVLDAAAELKRRGIAGIRFVLIGEGSQKPRLVERTKSDGLEPFVFWLDSIPRIELARMLPQFDAGMMILKNVPAFYYGTSPNKFFDYIASGLPILNNYPGWLADLIREHQCGLAVPPEDAGAFADAVIRLRDDPTATKRMGRRAHELARTRFSREDLADQFVSVLEGVCAHA